MRNPSKPIDWDYAVDLWIEMVNGTLEDAKAEALRVSKNCRRLGFAYEAKAMKRTAELIEKRINPDPTVH